MKKFLKTLALVAVAAVGAVSCTETIADDTITPSTTVGVTLYATTPSDDASTRIAFEDNDSEGIALSWEEGDTFNLYKEGETESVATFTCADAATGLFTSDVASLEETTYTARYNADVDDSTLAVQDGDAIANLDNACIMSATFTYGTDEKIDFEHLLAIMTFKFESAERPAQLVFENGSHKYTVNYTSITPDENNIYTSHIMIVPCGDGETSRTMTFSLYDSDGTAYDIRSVETIKAYEAGMRYTASVSDLANTVVSGLWTDFAAESFLGDVVYSDDMTAYTISTPEQLAYLATLVNGGKTMSGVTFTLNNDINLSGHEWVAIGTSSDISFQGTFDGNNYAVSNLYINQPDKAYQALFGYIYNGATVKNLSVSGSVVGKTYVGGIVGYAKTETFITNCSNSATVEGVGVSAASSQRVGGVVGQIFGCEVKDCSNSGNISGSGLYVGGVVGRTYQSNNSISNSSNSGNISGSGKHVGGVVGYTPSSPVINCNNTGGVSGSSSNVGGVVGYTDASVTNCYNTGGVSGTTYVGGVVGYNSDSVTNCYNAGGVSGTGTSLVGGVIGYTGSLTVTSSCYWASDATNTTVEYGIGDFSSNEGAESMTIANMQLNTFVMKLNDGAYTYNTTPTGDPAAVPTTQACAWKVGTDNFPTLDFDGVPSNQD